jgi:hypothetical protein
MEDQNMLLLMTMPIEESAREDAREYLRLRRGEELKKLRKRLLAEESALQAQQAREFAAPECQEPSGVDPQRERGGTSASWGAGLPAATGSL